MADNVKILMVQSVGQTLRYRPADPSTVVTISPPHIALERAAELSVDAIVYLAIDSVAADALRAFVAALPDRAVIPLVYVVSERPSAHVSLLKDGKVEAVFAKLPALEHLVGVIKRAMSIRQAQGSRATPRYPVRFKCMIKVVGSSGLVEGEVRTLGLGGFMARVPRDPGTIPSNERIRFSITGSGAPMPARIEGQGNLRWGESKPAAVGPARIGVQFMEMDAHSREQLLICLNAIRTAPA